MEIGDRMKLYEGQESDRKLIPLLPVMVRLDGKAFHTWTSDLEKPFSTALQLWMQNTTRSLMQATSAKVGYTQSDEITLLLYSQDIRKQIYFDGKIQKLTSVISSMCTAHFNHMVYHSFAYSRPLAFFDCRVWNVPNLTEAANCILWRMQDAERNGVQMLGRAHFSHNQLLNKKCGEIIDMLRAKGVEYHDLFSASKYGQLFFNFPSFGVDAIKMHEFNKLDTIPKIREICEL